MFVVKCVTNVLPPFLVLLLLTLLNFCFCTNSTTEKYNNLCSLGLSRTQTSFVYKGVKYIMYMSLCKPLRDLPRKYISMILNPGSVNVVILKKLESENVLLASGSGNLTHDSIQAKLESGVKCNEFLQMNLNYSVVIKFECSAEETEPVFEGVDEGSCLFIFKWKAPFVCFLSQNSSFENCSLQFENKVFDMTSLRHPSYYLIQQGEYRVYINFCAPVSTKECQSRGGVVSGCVTHSNKTFLINENISGQKFLGEKSSIVVELYTTQGVTGVISFNCKPDAFTVKPEMKFKKRHKFSVIIETSVVCLNDASCDIKAGDEKYSLPRKSNVEVISNGATFLLSPCGPLKRDSFWSGGESSAALINDTVLSLGSKRKLQVVKKGVVTLTLTEGSFCPGTRNRAATVIDFICSEDESDPLFVNKSDNCVFSFVWRRPSFCPVAESTGGGCVVRDPIYGITYNFTHDENTENDFEIHHNNTIFRLNLCGEIKKGCGSSKDASVCLLSNSKEMIVGKRSGQMYSFADGSLTFQLWGAECAPNVTSRVIVNVVCEFGTSHKFVPVFIGKDSNCLFNFIWYTAKICPKGKELSCVAKNKNGSTANLYPLRLLSSNYRVPKDSQSYFVLNVCGPLWYGAGETCPPSSAVCLVNKGKEFISVGEVKEDLKVTDSDEIILIYENRKYLPSFEIGFAFGAVITFICSASNEDPQYVGLENSKHSFKWKTKFACFNKTNNEGIKMEQVMLRPKQIIFSSTKMTPPERVIEEENPLAADREMISNYSITKDIHEKEEEEEVKEINSSSNLKEISCITSEPLSSVDLSVLEPKYISFSKCVRLYIDVCKQVSCVSSESNEAFSLGSRTDRPILDDRGVVTVNYYDGVRCGGRSNRSLSVLFVCNKSERTGAPVLKNQTLCSYTFVWETRVVCPKEVLILDKTSGSVINKSSNEVVTVGPFLQKPIQIQSRSNETFYVNLWSLDVDDGVSCNGNICEKKSDTWVSRGIFKNFFFYDYNYDRIVIEFDGGDLCKGTRRYSSTIYLNCSGNGIPKSEDDSWTVLQNDCELILELVTSCFDSMKVENASVPTILLGVFGALLIVAATGFAFFLYYNRTKMLKNFESSEVIYLTQRRKCLEKEW